MKTAIIKSYLMKAVGLAVSLSVLGANAANLLNLDATSLPGDKVELKLTFDQPVELPKGFTIDDPARIALDFAGVKSQLNAKDFTFNIGATRSVNVLDTPQRMRLYINLTTLKPYNTYVKGNDLYVIVGESSVSTIQSANNIEQKQIVQQIYGERTITNIDFRRSEKPGEEKVGNIIIDLSDAKISPNVKEHPRQIVLEFANTQVPEELRLRLDVQDFATPVTFVSAVNGNNKATVTIEAKGEYEHLLYQTNSKLVVSVREVSNKADPYKGANVSMNFQEIEVREALMLLIGEAKDKNGKRLRNLVLSDSVSGSVSLMLDNIPWDQALNIVLQMKGLDKREEGNTIFIAPAGELSSYYQNIQDSRRTISNLAPLRKEIIALSYAQATDIVSLYKEVTNDADEIGSIATDERTNSIVANKTQAQLEELRDLVTKLDVPLRQVMIEARIVDINQEVESKIGVKWSGSRISGNKYIAGMGTPPSLDATANTIAELGTGTGGTYGISIGRVSTTSILSLQLAALASNNDAEIVSQPRVIASDRTSANISIGQQIAYQEAASSGATTTAFQDATLELDVTPQITPDDKVLLTVDISNDSVLEREIGGQPALDTQTLTAEVLVGNGETIVLGGMIKKNKSKSNAKVPVLGDIPFVGRLFRSSTDKDVKREVLIFITPRIIDNRPMVAN